MDNTLNSEACRGCRKSFLSNIILRHVARAKKCKEAYGDDYEKFKIEKSIEKRAKYKQRNPEKVKASSAKYR